MIQLILVSLLILQLTGLRPHLPSRIDDKLISWVATPRGHLNDVPEVAKVAYPSLNAGSVAPTLGAKSSFAIDVATGKVLYEHNADEQRPIASITKLATVLAITSRHGLDEIVTVGNLPAYAPDDAILGLKPGQKFTVRSLLTASLIKSANDAADALAIYDAGSLTAFSERMNNAVKTWGLTDMHFSNPSGLVDTDNFATARGLARLARLDLTNSTVQSLVNTPAATITDQAGTNYSLTTTNKLLNDGRFHGIKTGYTAAAGESVVSLANVNGHDVITVVLGSPDRFGETTALVNYLQGAYTWQ